jgi:hypothetical protein
MSHNFLQTSSFHRFLKTIDYDLSEEERVKGCAHCGGALHRADYPRSPLGVPAEHREFYEERYSHCCAQCRKRTTSQSVRFFGRYWFPAPLLILISALMEGAFSKCCEQLYRLFGVSISKRTWKRWRGWWRESFIATSFWKQVTGIIPIEHLRGPFPKYLFSLYTPTPCHGVFPEGEAQCQGVDTPFSPRLVWVLRFVAPLTAGFLRAV